MTAETWSSFSASPFHAVDSAFHALSSGRAPLGFPAALLGQVAPIGMTDIPVSELRKILLAKPTPLSVRDVIWAELVRRSREGGGEWSIVALAMAAPALRTLAGSFGRSFDGAPEDLDAEIIAAFLHQLTVIDLDRQAIWPRLRWAAHRAAARSVEAEIAFVRYATSFYSAPPRMPYGHEDLVLERARREGVLTAAEVDLIGMTRLEEVELAEAALMLGVSRNAVKIRRQRAEARLVAWIEGRQIPSKSDLVQSRGRA
jgi:hypothetical protein